MTSTTSTTSTPTRRKNLAIGALWESITAAGVPFYSGHITLPDGTTLDLSIFPNKFRGESTTRPPLIIYTPDLSGVPTDQLTDEPHPF